MSATWTCPNCDRSVIGSVCYCMASEEAKLHGRIAELSQRLAERDAEVERLWKQADARILELEAQRNRAIQAATELALSLETVLDEYCQAESDMAFERGDCSNWTTADAIAELPLGVAKTIKLYVQGDGIEKLQGDLR